MKRALVVGFGRMGALHRKVLRDLSFAVTTVDPLVRDADYRSLSDAGSDFDVAVVSVPIHDLVSEALRVNLLGIPMLVEKPLAATLAEAVHFAQTCQGRIGVAYIERFNPKVLELREWLQGREVVNASFVRHNERPSADRMIDLLTHDVDLARYLDISLDRCTFDVEDSNNQRLRVITVNGKAWNLMAHDTSPLHGLWHAFLTGSDDVAKPTDAVAVFESALDVTKAPSLRAVS